MCEDSIKTSKSKIDRLIETMETLERTLKTQQNIKVVATPSYDFEINELKRRVTELERAFR